MRMDGPRSKKIKVEELPRYALRCGCDNASFCAVNAAEIALLTALLLLQVTTRPFFFSMGYCRSYYLRKNSYGSSKNKSKGSNEETPPNEFLLHIFSPQVCFQG